MSSEPRVTVRSAPGGGAPQLATRALITGASSGIGREFARELARRGTDLVLVARDTAQLERVRAAVTARFPARVVEVMGADLTDPADLARVADRLRSPEAPVDLLINNAGFGLTEPFAASELDAELRLAQLLVTAPLTLCHAALPAMLAAGRGGIINVASLAAYLPTGSYAAAKAHTVMLSRSLNARYRGAGVTVTAVCPGFVRTDFHRRMGLDRTGVPWFAWATPKRVVRDALRGFARGTAVTVTDWRYRLLRPLVAVVPDALIDRSSVLRSRGTHPGTPHPHRAQPLSPAAQPPRDADATTAQPATAQPATAQPTAAQKGSEPVAQKSDNPSIKDPDMYKELRKEGASEEKAARISNAAAQTSRSHVGEKGGEAGSYDDWSKQELYDRAKELDISGRSNMTREQLIRALRNH